MAYKDLAAEAKSIAMECEKRRISRLNGYETVVAGEEIQHPEPYFGTFDGTLEIPLPPARKRRRPLRYITTMSQLEEELRRARTAWNVMRIIQDLEFFEAPNYFIRHARIYLDEKLRRQK